MNDHDTPRRFSDLNLIQPLLANVAREGYGTATPVQSAAIPPALDGRDVLASAPTGTGKTAAFVLPTLQRLLDAKPAKGRPVRALVLAPTRELAGQIEESLRVYGRGLGLRHAVIYGGVGQGAQVRALNAGVDVLVATPGRLMDLMAQGHVRLDAVGVLILDEADRMLDMGFVPDVRKIARHIPQGRQTLMFSATVPPTIKKLVQELMDEPVRVDVIPQDESALDIEQQVMFVNRADKPDLLAHVVERYGINCGIVFSRTKHGADKVVKQLALRGIKSTAIHGNKNQNQRKRALDGFKSGRVPILVATDVAARGIDVEGVTHVVNYDLTHEPETYVHRIGRTGRAGAAGVALSFCDAEERGWLRDIQRLIRRDLDVVDDHPHAVAGPRPKPQGKPRGPAGRPADRPSDRPAAATVEVETRDPRPTAKPRHPLAKPARPARPAAGKKPRSEARRLKSAKRPGKAARRRAKAATVG